MQSSRRLFAAAIAGGLIAGGFGFAPTALADKGGMPNDHACHGSVVSIQASQVGNTPADWAQIMLLGNAGEFNALIRESWC
jgi:hypothetical protein